MIKHVVFIKLKEGERKSEQLSVLKDMLDNLPSKISELVSLEAGINFSKSSSAYDICLITEFKSEQDLDAYRIHPAHKEVLDYLSLNKESIAVVDFEN
ncbi:MAG: Dabb family protein [Bacteroidales bacterium]|nr:Dabb family protein [Bacteroidales bacterium]